MGYITSGNNTVDRIGGMNISGNVIPQIWYRTITRPNGKPYLLAITLLSDIVYWYRPSEVRDEQSGQIIGWRKRFHGDMLQKTYQQYAELYGESRKTVKTAMDCLENLGVIRRHFRDVTYGNGMTSYNVMFVELDANKLHEITFPEEIRTENRTQEQIRENDIPHAEFVPTPMTNLSPLPDKEGGRGYLKSRDMGTKKAGGSNRNVSTPCPKMSPPHTGNVGTNTEITTNITDKHTINPIYQVHSEIQQRQKTNKKIDKMGEIARYRQIIKRNIDYDCLEIDMKFYTGELEEILNLIVETVSVDRESIRIGGVDLPFQLVKGKFLKLNMEHIRYVIDCMKKNTTKIGNIRAYLLTALYNAPNTINNYYQSEVNHDMYGSK